MNIRYRALISALLLRKSETERRKTIADDIGDAAGNIPSLVYGPGSGATAAQWRSHPTPPVSFRDSLFWGRHPVAPRWTNAINPAAWLDATHTGAIVGYNKLAERLREGRQGPATERFHKAPAAETAGPDYAGGSFAESANPLRYITRDQAAAPFGWLGRMAVGRPENLRRENRVWPEDHPEVQMDPRNLLFWGRDSAVPRWTNYINPVAYGEAGSAGIVMAEQEMNRRLNWLRGNIDPRTGAVRKPEPGTDPNPGAAVRTPAVRERKAPVGTWRRRWDTLKSVPGMLDAAARMEDSVGGAEARLRALTDRLRDIQDLRRDAPDERTAQ